GSGISACEEHATVWVATAQDPKTLDWRRVARMSEATCKTAISAELAGDQSVSACTKVGKTKRQRPDAALVPTGKGWSCYSVMGAALNAQLGGGSPSHCFRTQADCDQACRPSHGSGIADDADAGCVAQKTAWVMTTNDEYVAARSAADCEFA